MKPSPPARLRSDAPIVRLVLALIAALAIAASALDVRCSAHTNTSGTDEALILCGANGCQVAANRGAQPAAMVTCSAAWRW